MDDLRSDLTRAMFHPEVGNLCGRASDEIARLQDKLDKIAKHPDTPLLIKQYARGDLDPK